MARKILSLNIGRLSGSESATVAQVLRRDDFVCEKTMDGVTCARKAKMLADTEWIFSWTTARRR